MAQVVKHPANKHEALISTPAPPPKKISDDFGK
jgi:hypothetical protein